MPLLKIPLAAFALILGLAAPALAQGSASTLGEAVEAWLSSPHANRSSEAFRHWDEDGEIPQQCATCHSALGFLDYLGGDGTPAGQVDHPAMLGAQVDCTACHSASAAALDAVTFPSGESLTGLGNSSACMVCHQGRQSGDDVKAVLAGLGDDEVSAELGFINVHYRAAAASLMGSAARGGYEYEGKSYAGRFAHVPPLDTCTSCHNPHGLEVAAPACASCHKTEDPLAIRTRRDDPDGDGDMTEGVAHEIAALHGALGRAIAAYSGKLSGKPVVYSDAAYPYFFNDLNGDGQAGAEEASYPNRYQSWTPRLLRAAYNYQFVAKDPGAYAHNPTYTLQLLIDSLDDLAEAVPLEDAGWTRP